MAEWFEAYSLDGVDRQILDNDLLFLFQTPEEVKESLNRCREKGQEFAICKISRNNISMKLAASSGPKVSQKLLNITLFDQ